jgi:hypothetical protein
VPTTTIFGKQCPPFHKPDILNHRGWQKQKEKNLPTLITRESGQRRQALPVNKIKEPLGRAAGLFIAPFSLLHRGFADHGPIAASMVKNLPEEAYKMRGIRKK